LTGTTGFTVTAEVVAITEMVGSTKTTGLTVVTESVKVTGVIGVSEALEIAGGLDAVAA